MCRRNGTVSIQRNFLCACNGSPKNVLKTRVFHTFFVKNWFVIYTLVYFINSNLGLQLSRLTMTTDWLLCVGDGNNLKSSSIYRIWGIQSTTPNNKYFLKNVKPGDRLWFVKSNCQGKLIGVAIYRSHNTRELGPLINTSMTEEELGWTHDGPDWKSDTEIHYSDLYGLDKCDLLTHIKGACTIRKYNEKCRVDLALEYGYIVRYSKITLEL